MDPTINAMMKQKQEKLILLSKLERKNSFLRDKIFEEKSACIQIVPDDENLIKVLSVTI